MSNQIYCLGFCFIHACLFFSSANTVILLQLLQTYLLEQDGILSKKIMQFNRDDYY